MYNKNRCNCLHGTPLFIVRERFSHLLLGGKAFACGTNPPFALPSPRPQSLVGHLPTLVALWEYSNGFSSHASAAFLWKSRLLAAATLTASPRATKPTRTVRRVERFRCQTSCRCRSARRACWCACSATLASRKACSSRLSNERSRQARASASC